MVKIVINFFMKHEDAISSQKFSVTDLLYNTQIHEYEL